jgi:hypothetical protein
LNINSSYNSWSYIVPNDCKIYAGMSLEEINEEIRLARRGE